MFFHIIVFNAFFLSGALQAAQNTEEREKLSKEDMRGHCARLLGSVNLSTRQASPRPDLLRYEVQKTFDRIWNAARAIHIYDNKKIAKLFLQWNETRTIKDRDNLMNAIPLFMLSMARKYLHLLPNEDAVFDLIQEVYAVYLAELKIAKYEGPTTLGSVITKLSFLDLKVEKSIVEYIYATYAGPTNIALVGKGYWHVFKAYRNLLRLDEQQESSAPEEFFSVREILGTLSGESATEISTIESDILPHDSNWDSFAVSKDIESTNYKDLLNKVHEYIRRRYSIDPAIASSNRRYYQKNWPLEKVLRNNQLRFEIYENMILRDERILVKRLMKKYGVSDSYLYALKRALERELRKELFKIQRSLRAYEFEKINAK